MNNYGFIFYSFVSAYCMIKEDSNTLTYNKFIESSFNNNMIFSEPEMFLQYLCDRYLDY